MAPTASDATTRLQATAGTTWILRVGGDLEGTDETPF